MNEIKKLLDSIENTAEKLLKVKDADELYEHYSNIVDDLADIDEELHILDVILETFCVDYEVAREFALREIDRRIQEGDAEA